MIEKLHEINFHNILDEIIYDDFFEILERDEERDIQRCRDTDSLEYIKQVIQKYIDIKSFFEKYFYHKFEEVPFDMNTIYSSLDVDCQKEIWKYYKVISELEKA